MTDREKIFRIIESSPFRQMTFNGVLKRSNVKKGSLSRALCDMVEQGKLIHSKFGKEGIYAINKKIPKQHKNSFQP